MRKQKKKKEEEGEKEAAQTLVANKISEGELFD
jgi:hypothetical protein